MLAIIMMFDIHLCENYNICYFDSYLLRFENTFCYCDDDENINFDERLSQVCDL